VLAGQGQAVENEIIEITTDFTLGEAAETIANNLRDALESQIPCSTITSWTTP
jgi:capsular polysaccharide biosynthesis protein